MMVKVSHAIKVLDQWLDVFFNKHPVVDFCSWTLYGTGGSGEGRKDDC